jgi:hypothetical protein
MLLPSLLLLLYLQAEVNIMFCCEASAGTTLPCYIAQS